ncbi:TIGR03084 family metal-binding protein [Dactylosporangium sp. CS-033363]|uniref:TIGR03084 family metal-binding protein n=1 Tax=Dactylosporangium sp. CS-033363 TaxID=3239935 RepID=UPI003D8AE89D
MTGQNVIAALAADGADVDRLVADLPADQWTRPTPAPRWTVAHQVAHLAATFRMAAMAAGQPDAFRQLLAHLNEDFSGNVERAMAPYLAEEPAMLLRRFREERIAAETALTAVPEGQVVPWLVRPIPAPVLAMAGMMELFGHGQDIADGLGVTRSHSDRLRYLCEFAVRVWDFGYISRGLATPEVSLGFDLIAPSGAPWQLGAADATERISGPAVDFCLLVTRRRHRDDLALEATGAVAEGWLDIAQAYRGPAGEGRRPGQFSPAASRS